ncbi:MAG: MFS transporter [Gammaproteobacteria bacterium]|nr:MFS transporter [Gammaproteobacteria bacterium]
MRALSDRRLRRIFLLGTASGFPWLLIGSAMTAWLTDVGLSRTGVGLFGAVFVLYTINFLWAPLVDHVRLPVLGHLGQRRSWIIGCQGLLIVFAVLLAVTGPAVSLTATALIAIGIAAASATQDLAIDAYRITVIGEDEPELLGLAAAMATCGWWTGLSLPGAVAFWLADPIGWPNVYLGMAVLVVPVTVIVWRVFQEPPRPGPMHFDSARLDRWVRDAYVDAVAEFFRRNGVQLALGLLAFIFLFKIGEAFLGRMVIRFYIEVGFSHADIGTYSKGLGWLVTMVCAVAAGLLTGRFGVIRGLLLAGIGMATTNLLFAWIAIVGPDTRVLAFAVVADGITSAFSTVAFVAFISYYTSRLHAAAQYGALASLGNSGRVMVASASGVVVDHVLGGSWASFFVITALMVTPSLGILVWIGRWIAVKDTAEDAQMNQPRKSHGIN